MRNLFVRSLVTVGLLAGAGAAWASPDPEPQQPKAFQPADGAAKAGAEPTAKEGGPIKIGGVTIKGLIRSDIVWDDSRPNANQTPLFIPSEQRSAGGVHNADSLTAHARNSRLMFDVDPVALKGIAGFAAEAHLDLDLGALIAPGALIREAYVKVKGKMGPGNLVIIAGQTWDLAGPLNPTFGEGHFLWAVGNLGAIRPQIRGEFWLPQGENMELRFALLFGQTGGNDGQDADGNGILDGEASGFPTTQIRAALRMKTNMGKNPLEVGLFGHRGLLRTSTRLGTRGRSHFDTWALGLDWNVPVMKQGTGAEERDFVWFMGELWTGLAVADLGGGVGQSLNGTTAERVQSTGIWLEGNVALTPVYTVRGGFTSDDPRNADLRTGGGRSRNHALFAGFTVNLLPWKFGAELYHWQTQFIGIRRGIDNRLVIFAEFGF